MSKLLNKPTPTVNELAKKYGVSVLDVKKRLMHGIKVEKEHTNNTKVAREIALDHLGEKLNYYKKLAKIEEETGSAGVRGLGYVSGDPAGTDYVQQYIDTNAMSYVDENGNKLEWIRKAHLDLHNKGIGYNFFNPKETKTASNFMNEQSLGLSQYSKLNELGGQVGYEGTSDPRSMRKDVQIENRTKGKKMKEDKDPCWKGYEMVGMKKKGGRKVPNCVPTNEESLDEVSKKLAFKAVRSGTYSDYDPDYNHPKRDAIKKAIGRKWGSEAEKHANKMVGDEGTGKIKSSGKSNRLKIDMLRTSNRVTASGKKNKQDVASTKRNIKDRLGTHPKPGHLPEESLDEVLTKKMSAGQVIHDFVHSDNPKFKGKSVKQRQKMALGAYYGMHPEKSKGE